MAVETYTRENLDTRFRTLLDPNQPLGTVAKRYFPKFNKKRNMIILSAGVWLMATGAILLLALLSGDKPRILLMSGAVALGCVVLAGALIAKRRADAVGGDEHRCGTYVLEDGILVVEQNEVLWIPRETVTSFQPDRVVGEAKETFSYEAVVGEEICHQCRLDSMYGLETCHQAQLQRWIATGAFDVEDWQYGRMPEAL